MMARSWLDSVEKRTPLDYYSLREKRPLYSRSGLSRSKLFLPIVGIVALTLIIYTFNGHEATSNATAYFTHRITDTVKPSNSQTSITSGTIRHVLSPADKGNNDVCKLVLSAAINNYNLVTLYNFHKTGNKLAKISGGLDYMNKLDSSHDDELLLIVDGFDEWFQLPASIMETRYSKINRRENERILTRTGKPYKQTIVISTQRQCWPGNGADISCYAAPESPLPAYIFGPQTDNMIQGWNNYAHLRPRYMNAGYTIGPVKDMRKLWTRAQEYSDEDPNVVGLDQNILARIWGEQNYIRETARFGNEPLQPEKPDYSDIAASTKSSNRRNAKRDLGYPEDKPAPARKSFVPKNNTNYEFGIGLDYGSELSLPTVFAEYDADWIVFSNASSLTAAFQAQNVTSLGATRMQNDIAALPAAPYAPIQTSAASVDGAASTWDNEEDEEKKGLHAFAEKTTWRDVPLFTNLWTGITPAIVHHNAWRDGLKDRRQTTWESMWFQPFARQLLDAWAVKATAQSQSLGMKTNFRGGLTVKFRRFLGGGNAREWNAAGVGLGAKTDNDREGNWVSWRELCGDEDQQEIFRDKKGPWVGPGGAKEGKGEEQEKERGLHNEPVR